VVFTSRHGLGEAKRRFHHNVHPLPDSVDLERCDETWARMMNLIDLTLKKLYYENQE
jgi:hypothetical protein